MKLRTVFFTLCFYGVGFAVAQSLYDDIGLEYGPQAVGYEHLVKTDRARPYDRVMDYANTLTFRPMPISSWYPIAGAESLAPVRISDYTRVLKEEEEYETIPDEYFFSWFYYPETPAGKANLDRPTHALKQAKILAGKHPVVIYAPSYGASSAENFVLCEYLASQGYLVLSTPSRGIRQRRLDGSTSDVAEAQLGDLNFLVGYASTLPHADLDRLYTIGFSFGGFPSALLAMSNRYVDGVISLDGTTQYHPGVLTGSKFFRPDGLRVPFVHISQKDIPEAVVKEDKLDPDFGKPFVFFDSLRQAPAYHFQSTYLTHGNFSAMGLLFEPRDSRQELPEPQIITGYINLCKRVAKSLEAMDDYRLLEAKWDHAAYLASGTDEMVLLAHKTTNTKRYTMRDFAATMRHNNYELLQELHSSIKGEYPTFRVKEGDLNTIGLQLGFGPATREAGIRVFQFALQLFPESGNLHDSLAEVYFMAGRRQEAKASFERSLALSPGNQNAVMRLRELR